MASEPEPGTIAQLGGKLAYAFAETSPLLPTYAHLILAAIFPIIAGSYASLARPNSAAKPNKKKGEKGEKDEEDEFQRMEGLAPSDALFFPVYAGITLTGLYYLIKWLQDPTFLNKLLNWYFAVVGIYGVVKFISDGLHLVHEFVFPEYYFGGAGIWKVDQDKRKTILINGVHPKERNSAMPGLLGILPLPAWVVKKLWTIRGLTTKNRKLTLRFYIHRLVAIRAHFDFLHVVAALLGLTATLYFNLIEKKWWLTNLLAFSFSYVSLQHISPTTFGTATLLMSGLFLYDIYMVFYTPMMVTVAKSLEIPAKLMFPRPGLDGKPGNFAMLGLGDVVLPGLVMGLALRFDLWAHYLRLQKKITPSAEKIVGTDGTTTPDPILYKAQFDAPSKYWSSRWWTGKAPGSNIIPHIYSGTFNKPYFTASLIGYIIGLITTLGVMQVWQHAQPALLYLVPGVLGSLFLTGLFRGELKLMWEFTEEDLDDETPSTETKVADSNPKEQKTHGIFYSLWTDLKKDIFGAKQAPAKPDEQKRCESAAKVEELEKSIVGRANINELVHFSITPFEHEAESNDKKTDGGPKWVEAQPDEPVSVEVVTALPEPAAGADGHVSKRLRTG